MAHHLGVIDVEMGFVAQQALADVDGWGLPGITRVLHPPYSAE